MADKKISQLTALSAANVASATDVLAIVDTSATETKKITAKDLIDGALNGGTANGVLYLNGSKIVTSGSGLVFDSSGNLGLGVTPSAWTATFKALQVSNTIIANNGSADSFFGSNYYFNGTNNVYISSAHAATYGQVDGAHQWYTAPSGTAGNTLTGANAFVQMMTLTSGALLQVAYPGNTSFYAQLDASDGNGHVRAPVSNMNLVFDVSGSERARITSGGLFQVNADSTNTTFTSPGQIALKRSNSLPFISWHADNGTRNGYLQINDASASTLSVEANQALTFQTNGAERARITGGGDFLVGTTATGLQTVRSMGFQVNAGCTQFISHSTADGSGDSYVEFGYNGTKIGSITQNGTTAVAYNTTSDYRLKTFISPVTGAGARLDALKPVEYEWKADGKRARGFFAHEFQQVYADSVTGEKDAVDAVGKPVYQAMQASTTEVIADLVAEIQSLRSRVAALEAQ